MKVKNRISVAIIPIAIPIIIIPYLLLRKVSAEYSSWILFLALVLRILSPHLATISNLYDPGPVNFGLIVTDALSEDPGFLKFSDFGITFVSNCIKLYFCPSLPEDIVGKQSAK